MKPHDAGTFYRRAKKSYNDQLVAYRSHLSRLNDLPVIMNISMVFSGLIAQGYCHTLMSLRFLGMIHGGMLIPCRLIEKLWYYLVYVVFECIGLYFLLSFIWYWERTGE